MTIYTNIYRNFTHPPFGMVMPNRSWTAASADGYAFGYNGRESDDDIKGKHNSLDFGSRLYDVRLGKWLSLDPLEKAYPEYSGFAFVGNNPIFNTELDGKYFVGKNEQEVKVTINEKGKIKLSKNASYDLKALARKINRAGSETALEQFNKLSESKTRVHFNIDRVHTGADGEKLLGYHQPHDENGTKLSYVSDNGDGTTGYFDGEVAFIQDDEGNYAFKEATITLYRRSFNFNVMTFLREENDYPKLSKDEAMVSTYAHESDHDINPINIQAIKDRQEGIENTNDVEVPANEIETIVISEIKEN